MASVEMGCSAGGGTVADNGSISLEAFADKLGVGLPHWQLEALRLSAAVQVDRRGQGATRRLGVTRSILLWAICQTSWAVAEVMSRAGLDVLEFGRVLKIISVPIVDRKQMDVQGILFEPELADALRHHLKVQGSEVNEVDLADALLQSALTDTGVGRLGKRLYDLKVDVGRARRELSELAAGSDGIRDEELSRSVSSVRNSLGPTTPVTAGAIVKALQVHHPEYADGSFASVEVHADRGQRRTVDDWLVAVRQSYGPGVVQASRHQVLDGYLTVLALAELEPAVAQDLDQNAVRDRMRRDAPVEPRHLAAYRTDWSTDSPATKDLLGRKDLAVALAERVKRLAYDDPGPREAFLVHIDGPWGAGKSSLFYFLQDELRHDNPEQGKRKREFLPVPINAWREQRVGVQWWTLLSALQREIAQDATGWRHLWVWGRTFFDRLRARWVPFVIAVLVLLGVMAAGLRGIDLTAGGKLADSALKLTSLASVVFAGIVAATRYLLPGSKRSAESLTENSENPTRQVGRLFARTLSRAPRPVVFLIDDLDRCDAKYVVEFLEVVQTLVKEAPAFLDDGSRGQPSKRRKPGPYGFVAADGRWIRSSYEQQFAAFQATTEPGRPLGYLFLEKVFQLHVLLPIVTPAAREKYFTTLLTRGAIEADTTAEQLKLIASAQAAVDGANSEQGLLSAGRIAQGITDPGRRIEVLGRAAVRFSERAIENATTHDLAPFVPLLDPNPRSMKLFVNTYGVLRSLRTLEEAFVPTEQLALWTVIEIRWPQLADHLRAHPSTIDDWKNNKDPLAVEVDQLLRDEAVTELLRDPRWTDLNSTVIRACAGVV